MGSFLSILDPLRDGLYHLLLAFQGVLAPLVGGHSAWLAIVALTVTVRVMLLPLALMQCRATRAMQVLAPEVRELRRQHADDPSRLRSELAKLYADYNARPLGGCLPVLLQAPVMVALFRVLASPRLAGGPNILLSQRFFVVSLAAQWTSLGSVAAMVASPPGLLVLALLIAIAATSAAAQRLSPQPAGQEQPARALVRLLPVLPAVFGVGLPVAVLLYWLTTNLWTLGQQYVLLRL